MQAGRRGRHRSPLSRVGRLIPLPIESGVRPFDIRGQGDVTDRVDCIVNGAATFATQMDNAAAKGMLTDHFRDEDMWWRAESRTRSGLHLLTGMHQHIPCVTVDVSKQQAFDSASAGIAMTDQARRNDTRVVDDEKVASRQERWKVRNALMPPPANGAIDHEQARCAALRGR